MLVTINIQQFLCTVINLHVVKEAIQSSSTLPFITNLTDFMSVRVSRTQSNNSARCPLREGRLEKIMGGGGEGNFRTAGMFFRFQIPSKNFF